MGHPRSTHQMSHRTIYTSIIWNLWVSGIGNYVHNRCLGIHIMTLNARTSVSTIFHGVDETERKREREREAGGYSMHVVLRVNRCASVDWLVRAISFGHHYHYLLESVQWIMRAHIVHCRVNSKWPTTNYENVSNAFLLTCQFEMYFKQAISVFFYFSYNPLAKLSNKKKTLRFF